MRSLLLGNGFEMFFNDNTGYKEIVKKIVNEKNNFLSLFNTFLKDHFKYKFFLRLFNITDEDIHNLIIKNIIFFDEEKSIEDNMTIIFDDVDNFFKDKYEEEISKEEIDIIIKELENDYLEFQKNRDKLPDDFNDFWKNFKNTTFKQNKKTNWKELQLDAYFSGIEHYIYNSKSFIKSEPKAFIDIFSNEANKKNIYIWSEHGRYDLPRKDLQESKLIENIIKKFFEFYIDKEFFKTKVILKMFFKLIPSAKIFLNSYDQIITTNYNNYDFLNNNTINIHGKINDKNESIIWFNKNEPKKRWKNIIMERNLTINNYNEIDIMGISLKNDENTLIEIINYATDKDDLVINYYAFSLNDQIYFKGILKSLLKKYEIKAKTNEDETYFEFPKQGYIFDNENNNKNIKIFIKPTKDEDKDKDKGFWGFSKERINDVWYASLEENNPIKIGMYLKERINILMSTNQEQWHLENLKQKLIDNLEKKIPIYYDNYPYRLNTNQINQIFVDFQKVFLNNLN